MIRFAICNEGKQDEAVLSFDEFVMPFRKWLGMARREARKFAGLEHLHFSSGEARRILESRLEYGVRLPCDAWRAQYAGRRKSMPQTYIRSVRDDEELPAPSLKDGGDTEDLGIYLCKGGIFELRCSDRDVRRCDLGGFLGLFPGRRQEPLRVTFDSEEDGRSVILTFDESETSSEEWLEGFRWDAESARMFEEFGPVSEDAKLIYEEWTEEGFPVDASPWTAWAAESESCVVRSHPYAPSAWECAYMLKDHEELGPAEMHLCQGGSLEIYCGGRRMGNMEAAAFIRAMEHGL